MAGVEVKASQSPLFNGIEQEKVTLMMECMGGTIKRFRKDELIFLSNHQDKYIGVLLEGRIYLQKSYPDGEQSLLTIIEQGEVIGEAFALSENASEYASFVAAENVTMLYVPYRKILHTCNNQCPFHQTMIENMFTMLVDKSVRLMQKIDISARKTLREKIIAFLQQEQKRQGKSVIELTTNRTVLAEYLGVNRSALARELSNMKRVGILDYEKNRFTLKKLSDSIN